MLYVIIIVLFAVLVLVAVKWALVARELRSLKATTVTVEAAIAAADRRYESGIMEGERRALKSAEDAVAARAATAARAAFRNATK
jgi:NADH:ubiquinone oxidoreductase subunit 3 (subunit A)